MEQLAIAWVSGVQAVIDRYRLPWIVQRLGCRAEYWFRETLPRNGGEAAHSSDPELEHYMHLAALNRGILLTPFHSMALMCPATTLADVEAHTKAFEESVQALLTN
jgi:glutamate-1-semialdehyde 2,1-aminomutase